MSTAKVIIADDHPLFRTALKQAIVECIDDDETLEVDNFHDLLTEVTNNSSLELVFLDLHMPGNDGFTGLTQLQNHFPCLLYTSDAADE